MSDNLTKMMEIFESAPGYVETPIVNAYKDFMYKADVSLQSINNIPGIDDAPSSELPMESTETITPESPVVSDTDPTVPANEELSVDKLREQVAASFNNPLFDK